MPAPPSHLLVSAGIVLVAAGCSSFQKPAFNREQGANGAEVFVVPFRESRNRMWYDESSRGRFLASALKGWARGNADDPLFVEGRMARDVLDLVREWKDDRITASDWRELSSGLFKYAVEGDITRISLRKPSVIGLYDAVAEAKYRVVNTISGRLTYEGEKTVTYGSGREMTPRILDTPSSENDQKIERHLLTKLAKEIGKDLYGSYEE